MGRSSLAKPSINPSILLLLSPGSSAHEFPLAAPVWYEATLILVSHPYLPLNAECGRDGYVHDDDMQNCTLRSSSCCLLLVLHCGRRE
ncbi:hypothetical protein M432DRAFT_160756 [Thermoascus aurantiacus ATCC 26904]